MGGGGGGGTFEKYSPQEVQKQIRAAELEVASAKFAPELKEFLDSYLASVNDRDVKTVQSRLNEVKEHIADMVGASVDMLYGGSVAKHTYVDGLSDIDSLLMLKEGDKLPDSPRQLLEKITQTLQQRIGGAAVVTHGRLAVTAEYPDRMQIQLIPAVERGGKLRVPSWRRDGWSRIDPKAFTDALTKRNRECNGKLIPTIKLAKAINGDLPESHRLTGYHLESLAIAAFRGYGGPKVPPAMLPHLFESIPSLVRTPMRDRTGQSIHVDSYLGRANSPARRQTSHIFARLAKRMKNATAARSITQWRQILGE